MKWDFSFLILFALGFVWEWARTHEALKLRSADRKYRFSTIRLFFSYNHFMTKIRVPLLAATLAYLPIVVFLKADVFFPAIFMGTIFSFYIKKWKWAEK